MNEAFENNSTSLISSSQIHTDSVFSKLYIPYRVEDIVNAENYIPSPTFSWKLKSTEFGDQSSIRDNLSNNYINENYGIFDSLRNCIFPTNTLYEESKCVFQENFIN